MTKRGDQPVDEVFAPPRPLKDTDASAWDVWREGITLVAHQGGQLPKRCVRCNRETKRRVELTLTETPLWVRGFGLLAPIAHPVLRSLLTRRGSLTVGACDEHYREWMLNRVFGGVLIVAILISFATRVHGAGNFFAYGFTALMAIGFLATAKNGHLVRFAGADANYVRVIPSQQFLDGFEDELEYEDDDEDEAWDDDSGA